MSYRTNLCVGLAAIFVAACLASPADADNRRCQRIKRWSGHWYGSGYHWRTPGPNPDYYNPYSAHNSRLMYNGFNAGYTPGMKTAPNSTIPYRIYASPDYAGPDQQAIPYRDRPGHSMEPTLAPQPSQPENSTPESYNAVESTPADKAHGDNDGNFILKSGQIQNQNDWPIWEEFMPAPEHPKLINPSLGNQ